MKKLSPESERLSPLSYTRDSRLISGGTFVPSAPFGRSSEHLVNTLVVVGEDEYDPYGAEQIEHADPHYSMSPEVR